MVKAENKKKDGELGRRTKKLLCNQKSQKVLRIFRKAVRTQRTVFSLLIVGALGALRKYTILKKKFLNLANLK